EEPGLRLSRVIGTTTISATAFATLPPTCQFAYAAGAVVVLAAVDENAQIKQRFFRARSPLTASGREGGVQATQASTGLDSRSRVSEVVRDQKPTVSPLSAARDWSDSPTGRSSTARDRVKAITSVALSPNGRWLAAGETGYRPRVLIFPLATDTSELPITTLSEHTFGIHGLSFSQDSQHLASLGTINDGFLYVWRIDERSGSATLAATNKCTALVNCIAWVGQSIVTVGLRYVKVWQLDEISKPISQPAGSGLSPITPRHTREHRSSDFGNSILGPKHKVLSGKNSLLGDLLDCNFTILLPYGDNEAIVCASTGEICLLADVAQAQDLMFAVVVDYDIAAARLGDSDTLTVGSARQPDQASGGPIAGAVLGNIEVKLLVDGTVSINGDANDTPAAAAQLTGHSSAIAGVQSIRSPAYPSAAFLTFDMNGIVRLWNAQAGPVTAFNVPLDRSQDAYGSSNQVVAATVRTDGLQLAAGDRYGTLTVLHLATDARAMHVHVRAHSTEITDLCAFDHADLRLLVSASRDRTVQLFAWFDDKLELLQTLQEHAGAVNGLLATQAGRKLLSCSADRSIVIREAWQRDEDEPGSVAYVTLRTIALKSAPTSICMCTDDSLLVAATDRTVTKYDINSGQSIMSFKCTDNEYGEAAILSRILYSPSLNGCSKIIGVSSSDKSIRLYSDSGSLIARDWGHTEGITDCALVSMSPSDHAAGGSAVQVVTVAADSTMFVWDTSLTAKATDKHFGEAAGMSDTRINTKSSAMGAPLRKVISHSDLARFRRGSSTEDGEFASPTTAQASAQASSPQRLRKKASRLSIAQTPRLEPAFRSSFAEPSRRQSLRQRSPSPPKSVSRTLRAYRKKLAGAQASDSITPEALRELERELKLTARVLSEKSQGKTVDEAMIARLLDQASEKIVGMLD
ncbi:hypothetical protein BAUCODRAFT_41361, partial [Baudoinia panamericana UAMH 10762]